MPPVYPLRPNAPYRTSTVPVFQIRILRIRKFLGFPNSEPLFFVRIRILPPTRKKLWKICWSQPWRRVDISSDGSVSEKYGSADPYVCSIVVHKRIWLRLGADPRTSCGTRCSYERVRPPPSSSWTSSYRSWTPPPSSSLAASTWTSTRTISTESGRPPANTAQSLDPMYLSERKEVGYGRGHLCIFCGYQREKKRGTGRVIFVLSVHTKGKRRGVQDRSSLYFLWLPKGKEERYRTVHIFTFSSCQREKKRGTGQVIFVLSVVTKGKRRGVQDGSSLYFLFIPKQGSIFWKIPPPPPPGGGE
jgi:hypothetical protein